jgi:hypothetical protein
LKTYLIPALLVLVGRCVVAQSVSPLPVHAFTCTYTARFSDAFAMMNNPASLVSHTSFTAGLYAHRYFMLPEPVQYVLTGALPMKNAGLGIHLNYFRAGPYRQSEAGIAYARKLGKIDLGIRINYHGVTIAGYGNARAIVMDAGSTWHITNNLHAGVRVYNPVGGRLGKDGEKLGYLYSMGFGYEVSEHVLLSMQATQTEDKPLNIQAGLHYQPTGKVMIQAGISTSPAAPYLAAGYQLKPWRLLLSVSYHGQLGCSPTLLFTYKSTRP